MTILEDATRTVTVDDLAAFATRIGLRTPSDAGAIVRRDRDARRR